MITPISHDTLVGTEPAAKTSSIADIDVVVTHVPPPSEEGSLRSDGNGGAADRRSSTGPSM